MDQQQRSPNGEQRSSPPISSEIMRELSHYTSSTTDTATGIGNELPLSRDGLATTAGDGGVSRNSQTSDLSRQLRGDLLTSALEMRGTKRKSNESQGNTQIGVKHTSAAARFPGLSIGSGGLSFPPMSLNSSSLLGNLGHVSHPLLMGGSGGGSSFLQTPGQSLADLQTMFPSAASELLRQTSPGNRHLPTNPSSSSLSTVFSSASSTIPLSSTPSAATSASLASGSLPPYLMNPNVAGLLSSGFPLNYSQSLLSEPRMFPGPLLSGSGGFPAPNSSSSTSSFLSHYNNPTSSLLGAALTQPDRHLGIENGGSSSDDDDDVIEVTGQ